MEELETEERDEVRENEGEKKKKREVKSEWAREGNNDVYQDTS